MTSECLVCGSKRPEVRICLRCRRPNCNLGVIKGLTTCGRPRMCLGEFHNDDAVLCLQCNFTAQSVQKMSKHWESSGHTGCRVRFDNALKEKGKNV